MFTKLKFLLLATLFFSLTLGAPFQYIQLESIQLESNLAPLVSSRNAEVIPDQYIVVFKKQLPKERVSYHHDCIRNFVEEENLKLAKRGILDKLIHGISHIYDFKTFKGYAGRFTKDVLNKIRQSDEVAWIEKDQMVYASDIQRNAPWGLARISHRPALTFSNYNKYLYDPQGGEGVTVYVIDTGINVNHTDFDGRAVWGATIPENDEDMDGNGHGTHVAGTIAGKRYGVAKKAKVVAVKVLRSNGSGTMSDVIKGVEFAAEAHQKEQESAQKSGRRFKGSGANMSLGGGRSKALDMVVDGAVEVGLNFAVAAGNDNRDACDYSPAASQNSITVGASTIGDERAWFSNHGSCVDVFAPGKDVTSAWIGSRTATNTISGTSMASPHVAGLMAYLLSLQPDNESEFFSTPITPKVLKDLIIELSTKNALAKLPANTDNYLIFNNFVDIN